ncbi:peptide ABC transporter ATP-binding protein [Clostridia bacterium]|nr:peptide ABC transporter ATP-binding protein [Clostridia bacterium]
MNTQTSENTNLLEIKNLSKYFPIKSGLLQRVTGHVRAVEDISFTIPKGSTLGLVGESGCGKTTAGRTLLQLYKPTKGEVFYNGMNLAKLSRAKLRKMRPEFQMIFQDPYSSLSPRMPVSEIIGEGVRAHGIVGKTEYEAHIKKIMEECGLQSHHMNRYPHEFSGGQRQRICIARALALNPSFIVCDEPVSALDVSIQAQIINLLKQLQKERGLTYLFISHDLSVVEHISDNVGVMYLGSMVELAAKEELYANPLHPYTKALLSAAPIPDPKVKMNRTILSGDIPSPANPPSGCKFHTRCPQCKGICEEQVPQFQDTGDGHYVACHFAGA